MKTIFALMFILLSGVIKGLIKLTRLAFFGQDKKAIKIPETKSHRVPVVSGRVMRKYEALESRTHAPIAPQKEDFEVADHIVAIRFDPPVGVVHLRVFTGTRTVKRDLIIHDPVLKGIMRGRRFNLPDAPYEPAAGMEPIKDETVSLAEKLINEIGNRNVKCVKPSKTQTAPTPDVTEKRMPAVATPKASVPRAETKEGKVAVQSKAPSKAFESTATPNETKVFQPRVSTGFTYMGRLKSAQHRTFSPPGRASYETYEATIQMDNGAELPMRGAELEREIESAGCKIGDLVSITPMGKVPVTLPDGKEGTKNLYKVIRMETA